MTACMPVSSPRILRALIAAAITAAALATTAAPAHAERTPTGVLYHKSGPGGDIVSGGC